MTSVSNIEKENVSSQMEKVTLKVNIVGESG